MPRLHKFVRQDGYYVLTSISGSVITYRISPEGERKLAEAGIIAGQTFDRALLLDLYRTGDAFAPGNEFPEAVEANQLEMDFAGDPNPESAFPVCDGCRSPEDLHLTISGDATAWRAQLRCSACRQAGSAVDASVPLALMNRTMLGRLFTFRVPSERSENVRRYEALLDAEFASRWEAVRKQRQASQSQLFGDEEMGTGSLTLI